MFGLVSIPPLPSGWPFAPRNVGPPEERVIEASLEGLGSGWTLYLRGSVPLDGPASVLPKAFGRGGIQRIGDIVVRPYRRGGLVRHVNDRLYLSPARFAQEFSVHRALWAAGFPTVEPVGYGFRHRGWGVEGVYCTRYVEAAAWPTCWERSPQVLPLLATVVEALATWSLHAPDLNATNILLTPDGRVLALDWDRAYWTTRQDLRSRYRERLVRSTLKLGAPADVVAMLQRTLSADAQRDPIDDNGGKGCQKVDPEGR